MHNSTTSPSPLFALTVLALLHRLRPEWVAISVSDAARCEGINPQRISRLCSRAQHAWQATLEALARRGRPCFQPTQDAEVALLKALLQVATSLLAQVNLSRPSLRALVVGAWLRLRTPPTQLTQRRFCQALALSPRTLRSWLTAQATAPEAKPTTQPGPVPATSPGTRKRKARARKPRRPRFRFDLTVPGTQLGADTTGLSVFGVPLKLMAAQDIGGRDQNLFECVLVDHHEDSERIIEVLTTALAGRTGMQVITDQGAPYMAHATQAALDALGAEQAPQREADPLGKATVERAFRTLKDIAAPLFALTDQIAAALPALHHAELARSAGRIVILALGRAYQAGARAARRAAQQRSGLDEGTLDRVAQRAREQARAEDRSKRLLLTELHRMYQFDQPLQRFIRLFRRFPLSVLQEADSNLRPQLHRNDIRSLWRYFGAIVRTRHDEYCTERERRAHLEQDCAQSAAQARQDAATHRASLADPGSWLREALDALAAQWLPEEQQLLFNGAGIGLGWMRGALRRLLLLHGHAATYDLAHGVMNDCARAHHDRLGQPGVDAIRALLERELQNLLQTTTHSGCSPGSSSDTLWNIGRKQRPSAPNPLRI